MRSTFKRIYVFRLSIYSFPFDWILVSIDNFLAILHIQYLSIPGIDIWRVSAGAEYLDNVFSHHWVGRGSEFTWSSRGLDLNLKFFL